MSYLVLFCFCSTVPPPRIINVQVLNATNVSVNSDVVFSIIAEGLRLSYAWQRVGGPLLISEARYEGEDTDTLTIRRAEMNDSGSYVCAVSNSAGTETSTAVLLTVCKYKDWAILYIYIYILLASIL